MKKFYLLESKRLLKSDSVIKRKEGYEFFNYNGDIIAFCNEPFLKVTEQYDAIKKIQDKAFIVSEEELKHLENLIYCHIEDHDELGISARKMCEYFKLKD